MSAAVVDGLYGILSALILNKMSSSFSTARYFLLALLIIIFCRRSSAPLVRGAGKTEGFD